MKSARRPFKMGHVFDHNGECLEAPFEEGTFTKLEEKTVVELLIKVLQKQQVEIKGHDKHYGHCQSVSILIWNTNRNYYLTK